MPKKETSKSFILQNTHGEIHHFKMQKMFLCHFFSQLGSLKNLILILAAYAGQPSLTTQCAPSWLCELKVRPGNLQNTQSFSPAPCACSWVFSCHRDVAPSGKCTHRIQVHWGCITWKTLTETRLKTCFLQSWLFVCWQGVSTKDGCWNGFRQGQIWMRGQSGAGVSAQGEIRDWQCRAKAVTPTKNCCCCWGGFCSIWYCIFLQ